MDGMILKEKAVLKDTCDKWKRKLPTFIKNYKPNNVFNSDDTAIHVARMDSSNPVRKVFESEPGGGCRSQGRPPERWAKQVDENRRT